MDSYKMFEERKARNNTCQGYGLKENETLTGEELQKLLNLNQG